MCPDEGMNYRTQAEFFIKGITQGVVEANEVIAWSDEVIVSAPKSEDWMVEISSCTAEDRLKILGLLNTVKGEADATELAALLKARGLS
jgi:glycine cleavage system H lipoate-binding protein